MTNVGSPELRAFLARNIDSVETLELLLLLHERGNEAPWTAETITAELRSSEVSIRSRLDELAKLGLVATKPGDAGRFQLQRGDRDVEAILVELAELYRKHPYSIMELIFSKPLRAVQTFADAFRLRRKKNDG